MLRRMDPQNWKGGRVPQAGQTVSFPTSFGTFGKTSCTTLEDCRPGGIVTVAAPKNATENTPLSLQVGTLMFPQGKLEFRGPTRITLNNTKTASKISDSVSWDDHGEETIKFNCANNWVVNGTKSNPSFAVPCAGTNVVFPDVSACFALFKFD